MLAMMQQLKERQDHYEERLDRFEERMARMEERQEQFDKRQQEFAERQDQFDKRQQEFAERQEQFDKRQQEFAERQDQFDKRQGSFEKQLAKMQDDIASLKGTVLELKYKDRAPSIFGRYLRKVKPVAIDDLLETLEAIKPLTDKELDELLQADFIFSAVKASTREPIYVVMEISYVVDRGDVLRAIQRAQVLKDRGIPAIPAVAGEQATKGAKRYAERGEVLLALDGVIRGMTSLNPSA
jgi:DNA repair exonuclease SbcCD ATPase subunit